MITDDDTPTPDIEMYEVYDAYGHEGYLNSPPTSPLPSLRGTAGKVETKQSSAFPILGILWIATLDF